LTQIGDDIELAASLLKAGKLVAIPTETVYGLAANAYNLKAVASIFEAKNRPFFDPLILHCASAKAGFALLDNYPPQFDFLASKYWPGPLTLAAPKVAIVPDMITAGSPIVAVRVPAHPLTLRLLTAIDFPLAAPSANPFGYVSPTTAQHVQAQLGDKVDYILDGGSCQIGIESTILGYKDNAIELWRLGGISIENIEETVGEKLAVKIHKSSNPDVSGQLDKHYSPTTQMDLLDKKDFEKRVLVMDEHERSQTALLVFGETMNLQGFGSVLNLSAKADTYEAAHHLYAFIRQLDAASYKKIIALRLPEIGLGRAINDRLQRAASK